MVHDEQGEVAADKIEKVRGSNQPSCMMATNKCALKSAALHLMDLKMDMES